MKLAEARGAYYEASGMVSTLSRQMCLAGIAVAWIVRLGTSADIKYVDLCGWVFVLLIGSLLVDFLQYFVQAVTWGVYNSHCHKKGLGLDDDVKPNAALNTFPIVFWILKSLLALLGMFVLGAALLGPIIKGAKKEDDKRSQGTEVQDLKKSSSSRQ